MLQPPVSDLAPWRPGHWITQTGYALNDVDVCAGVKKDEHKMLSMLRAMDEVDFIISRLTEK